ncbi:EamA/RhaT family transporter, partial [Francisella tularensis subsp. holarctica]|nr:EamA/RhaT family transporter [Francisella tularensis subsp. holarctica]
MSIQRQAILALFLVTTFWGVTFPLLKMSLAYISPGLFVANRLSLSCLLFKHIILRAKYNNKLYLIKVVAIFVSL